MYGPYASCQSTTSQKTCGAACDACVLLFSTIMMQHTLNVWHTTFYAGDMGQCGTQHDVYAPNIISIFNNLLSFIHARPLMFSAFMFSIFFIVCTCACLMSRAGNHWTMMSGLLPLCHGFIVIFLYFKYFNMFETTSHNFILAFLTFRHLDTWTFGVVRRAGVLRALLVRGGCPRRPRLFRRTCGCGKFGNMLRTSEHVGVIFWL